MLDLLSRLLSPVYCDAPEPWQIGFQDGASPTFEGISELHNSIFFYLVVIFVGVVWVIGSVVVNFSSDKSPIVYKYANHGTLIELVWTITPAFILIAIAFPSFKLLYLMDSPGEVYLGVLYMAGVPVRTLSSNSTALVPFGPVGLTLNMSFTRNVRNLVFFPKQVISQLVGHLLGDGSLVMTHTSVTPYFVFTQTIKKLDYVWHVFTTLGH